MKQFIRLFLWVLIPIVLWFTRHQTIYPQAVGEAYAVYQSPHAFYLQPTDYSDADIAWAKQFLIDSLGFNFNGSTEQKIVQLGRYLVQTLHPQMHESSDSLMQQSPLDQFKQIRYHHASFYCSNYVAIYGFFARVAGLAVRDIEIKSNARWHIVSETWNKETQQWVLTDLTHQLPLVHNASGKALGLFDPLLPSALPSSVQADYTPKATRFIHQKNNALHLQSIQQKAREFFLSKPGIVAVQPHQQAAWWPVGLKYLAMLGWFFLSLRILRGQA